MANSPKSVAKGLQRIGRSGHSHGKTPKGRMLVFDLDDAADNGFDASSSWYRVDLIRYTTEIGMNNHWWAGYGMIPAWWPQSSTGSPSTPPSSRRVPIPTA